ncbi:hypothetical protein [Murdochiella vaginalis]|uniref:hypothetical protein n=1 Tax=Murdochiella vaginalis TaxID=1852373 RepID=UPI0008FE693F|nr:hypothetical protein [Murdochiella vaginalis]
MDNRLLQVEEGLENRFLYQNDPDSMHILLSMIDHRQKLANLQPGYRLMKQMNTSLNRSLRYRKDRDYIVSAIKKLINDDVNRFELAVFLKGYVSGGQDAFFVDRLERLALQEYEPEQLEMVSILYHHCKQGKVMGLQSMVFHHIKTSTKGNEDVRRFSNLYCRRVLRKKILQLNGSLDTQIVLDFDHLSRLTVEESGLELSELNMIYGKINHFLYNNIAKVYRYAFWMGLNDAVLDRYAR